MEYYCFLKTMFELLLDYLQIRFGNLDTCGQDVLDTDNDIRPVGICGNLAFNTGEIALDNTHPVAYNKGAIVEADTSGFRSITNMKSDICLSGTTSMERVKRSFI